MARIKGSSADNYLRGTETPDDIFGAQGNDDILGYGGLDYLRGGRGNDNITIMDLGWALGGVGNDQISGEGAMLGGGPGNDMLFGIGGDLFGDAVPGERSARKGGNDTLYTNAISGQMSQTGGAGADLHIAQLQADGVAAVVHVLDFKPGADHVGVQLRYPDGNFLGQDQTFGVLDTNANGVLGDDVPWDGNSQVFSDTTNDRLVIRLHDDHLVIEGVTHLTAADWAF